MSAWRVGTGDATVVGLDATQSNFRTFIDKLTKWIPGDVLALYVAGVSLLLSREGGGPSIPLLIVGSVATVGVVLLGAKAANNLSGGTVLRAFLALVAFAIWSATVPGSGWQEVDLVADNPEWVTIGAALAGIFYGIIAEMISPEP
jgi:hypothetical protein